MFEKDLSLANDLRTNQYFDPKIHRKSHLSLKEKMAMLSNKPIPHSHITESSD